MNILKKLAIIFGILSISLSAYAKDAKVQKTLLIASEGAFPPFEMIDKNGNLIGFDIDLAQALCDEMKVKCKFIAQDWDGLIPGLLVKKFDAIVASMSVTEERKKVIAFTEKYYTNKVVLVGKKTEKLPKDLLQIKDKSIGAQRSTVAAQYLENTYGKSNKVKLYDTQNSAYLDLSTGRIDLLMSDIFPVYEWLQTSDGKDYAIRSRALPIGGEIAIGVRKADNDLRLAFNKAIKAIVANGEYKKINDKYFPFSIY